MAGYFENFSIIEYNKSLAINITQRTAILSSIFGNRFAFYPYRVKNGMRAEEVAEKYYGDPKMVWLVYFSNDIVDPYHQWPMDDNTFEQFIIDKYGSVATAQSRVVSYRVNWYEDDTKLSESQYDALEDYEKKYWTPNFDSNNLPIQYIRKEIDFQAVAQDEDGNITLSIDEQEQDYWSPVTAYEYEEEENSKKASIKLLDSRLAKTAETNLRDLLRE